MLCKLPCSKYEFHLCRDILGIFNYYVQSFSTMSGNMTFGHGRGTAVYKRKYLIADILSEFNLMYLKKIMRKFFELGLDIQKIGLCDDAK